MVKNGSRNLIGGWAFLIGVLFAIVLGAFGSLTSAWITTFVIIGLIIGLLNISSEETQPFLLSGAVLLIASGFGGSVIGTVSALGGIFDALLAIFAPAVAVVAIRNVFGLARS